MARKQACMNEHQLETKSSSTSKGTGKAQTDMKTSSRTEACSFTGAKLITKNRELNSTAVYKKTSEEATKWQQQACHIPE